MLRAILGSVYWSSLVPSSHKQARLFSPSILISYFKVLVVLVTILHPLLRIDHIHRLILTTSSNIGVNTVNKWFNKKCANVKKIYYHTCIFSRCLTVIVINTLKKTVYTLTSKQTSKQTNKNRLFLRYITWQSHTESLF